MTDSTTAYLNVEELITKPFHSDDQTYNLCICIRSSQMTGGYSQTDVLNGLLQFLNNF